MVFQAQNGSADPENKKYIVPFTRSSGSRRRGHSHVFGVAPNRADAFDVSYPFPGPCQVARSHDPGKSNSTRQSPVCKWYFGSHSVRPGRFPSTGMPELTGETTRAFPGATQLFSVSLENRSPEPMLQIVTEGRSRRLNVSSVENISHDTKRCEHFSGKPR